jgi:CheY-like chemotaxis protein/ribonuclease BN (tRNA processing enzyme)
MVPAGRTAPLILVAEDVEVISLMITKILEGKGFEVAHAANGEKALELGRSLLPDLIILDLMMPKMNGLDVLKHLRSEEETHGLGVIICSAKNFKTEMDQAQELGIFGFLPKPFHRRDLVEIIDRFFAARTGESTGQSTGQPIIQTSSAPATTTEIYTPSLDTANGFCRFWGTRGSIPVSGPRFVRHGGNTTCMELQYGEERIIFDAGSGIRDLGMSIMADGQGPRKLHLFITHTHWDHIQGFPFFVPAYVPGFDITVYGSSSLDKDLKSIFQGQLDRSYFPVQMEDMQANLNFKLLSDAPIHLGDLKITWDYTMHPSATVGFKIETSDKKIAFVPDNEFLKGYQGPPQDIIRESELSNIHGPLIDFLTDLDVLIHEAQYTNEEYGAKIGWGHSCLSNACSLMRLTQPKKWLIPHHDPMHDDDFLQGKINLTRQILRQLDCPTEAAHAFDGMVEYL